MWVCPSFRVPTRSCETMTLVTTQGRKWERGCLAVKPGMGKCLLLWLRPPGCHTDPLGASAFIFPLPTASQVHSTVGKLRTFTVGRLAQITDMAVEY